jgi:2-haloacid dehalogenase
MVTLGFDVYGTLIDTAGIAVALERHVGDRAAAFAKLWREKQLEYVFRRGLMQSHVDFAVCTRQALDYCCLQFHADLGESDRDAVMGTYRELPAYPDALRGLQALSRTPARLFAFSMGRPDDVAALLERSSLDAYFEGFVSVAETKTFKPNPDAYAHFLRQTGASREEAWLVSGNPFDVIGAVSAGMNGAWVRRSAEAVFDPWEIAATVTVDAIHELVPALQLQTSEA